MTKQDKIDAIRKACIKANPEILELRDLRIEERSRKVSALTITEDLLRGIENISKYPTRAGPIAQARVDGFQIAKGFLTDILNQYILQKETRPVRLADVLLAIEANREPLAFKLSIDTKGYMTLFNYKWEPIAQTEYNFHTDDLTQQSEEFIDFLYDLLK